MAKKKLYSFTDHPEHKAQLDAWRDKWIANNLNCAPMLESDRDSMRTAIDGLHRAAGKPEHHRTIFVSSPIVAAIAATIASAAHWLRDNPSEARKLFGSVPSEPVLMASVGKAAGEATRMCIASLRGEKIEIRSAAATADATYAATEAATYDATADATDAATADATYAATEAATYDATADATDAATYAATYAATAAATEAATADATYAATYDATLAATAAATRAATYDATLAATAAATAAATEAATYDATYAATADATDAAAVRFLIMCTMWSYRMRSGGNMWSAWVSYVSFFRHVSGLPIDYSGWEHYESAAVHAGPRYLHEKFCIVSDRPEFIHRDDANRPHRIDGPYMRWRDGVELHYIHGVRVTSSITRGDFTARDCLEQRNAEVRRVMIDKYNAGDSGRWMRDVGAPVISSDVDALGNPRRLMRIELDGDEPYLMIEVTNSTPEPDGSLKLYTFRCHPELRPHSDRGMRHKDPKPQEINCQNAIASTYGFYGHEYVLAVET